MLLCQIIYIQERVNHFNLQLFLYVTDLTEHRVFYQMVKLKFQFKTSYKCMQFHLCILYCRPEDDSLRLKCVVKLKI